MTLLIRIDPASDVPITRQIINQIRNQCCSGLLEAGCRLPSIRELARQLAVNQNTVLRAYERLTAEGVLERRHGEGTYVSATVRKQTRRRNTEALLPEVQALVDKAIVLDIDPDVVHALLDQTFEQAHKTVSS